MAVVKIDVAAEFTGAKAFKQADTATQKLTKNVKQLAGAFGVAFGTTAVLAYAKASVKAAAADQKAQQQLALALNNVGLGRDAASSEAYIQRLQSEFGIVDDLLRPSYQTLAVATRDSAEAQRIMSIALDVAAANSLDLGLVTKSLSKAFLGNNTSLTKLGIGLSKADLKTKSFKEITDQLAVTFAGAATAAANTFQGSIDKLGVASANVKEIIGTGLIDALKGLGDENSVDDLAKSMESAALYTADVIRGIGVLTDKLKALPGVGSFNIGMIPIVGSYLEILRGLGKVTSALDYTAASSATAFEKGIGISNKLVKNAKTLTAETSKQLAAAKLKTAIDKANSALGKGSDVFNIDKIQLAAAEKGQIEQLGKVTSTAQLIAITNDLARLKVKRDIIALDEAIATQDEKAITAATNRLNEDLKVFGALSNQKIKLAEIETILKTIAPKELIDLKNLNEAIRLLGVISGGKGTATSTGTGTAPTKPSSLNPRPMGSGFLNGKPLGFTNQELQYFEDLANYQSADLFANGANPFATSGASGGSAPVSITVNTGVGDPNAIAEAINQVLTNAQQRGTLRAYATP